METRNNIDRFVGYVALFAAIGVILCSAFGALYNILLGHPSITVVFTFILILGSFLYYLILKTNKRGEINENKK